MVQSDIISVYLVLLLCMLYHDVEDL
jgi:hypothetical protein